MLAGGTEGDQSVPRSELQAVTTLLSLTQGDIFIYVGATYAIKGWQCAPRKPQRLMATIGRHKAIVEVKKIRYSGVAAWFTWLFLHLFYLMGGRNRIGTIADWFWNYFTFDRGNRHIMDSM